MLDTLIRGAKIVDGTGKAAFTADVGILDGMIEAVGNLSGAQAFETIEAAGRVLTPGFIDMHRHADAALFREGFGEAELCQGLTTLVNGNCGMSLAPLSGAHADECAKYLAPITGNIPPELRFASIDSYFKAAQGRELPLSCAELIGMGALRTLYRHLELCGVALRVLILTTAAAFAKKAAAVVKMDTLKIFRPSCRQNRRCRYSSRSSCAICTITWKRRWPTARAACRSALATRRRSFTRPTGSSARSRRCTGAACPSAST